MTKAQQPRPAKGQQSDAASQFERFIAKARELGLDEREEAFDAVLEKVARHKSTVMPAARSDGHEDR